MREMKCVCCFAVILYCDVQGTFPTETIKSYLKEETGFMGNVYHYFFQHEINLYCLKVTS